MAHTKAKGTTKLGRDSESKRLGVKLHAGETAHPGNIIIRQRGSHFTAGKGTMKAKDDTIMALCEGVVSFQTRQKKNFNGSFRAVKVVHVY